MAETTRKAFWRETWLIVLATVLTPFLTWVGKALWPHVATAGEQVVFYGLAAVAGGAYTFLLLRIGERIARRGERVEAALRGEIEALKAQHASDLQSLEARLRDDTEIERIREMWIESAQRACNIVHDMFERTMRWRWNRLGDPHADELRYPRAQLRDAVSSLSSGLQPGRFASFSEAQVRLKLVVVHYKNCSCFVNRDLALYKDMVDSAGGIDQREISSWQRDHREFAANLTMMARRTRWDWSSDELLPSGTEFMQFPLKPPPKQLESSSEGHV